MNMHWVKNWLEYVILYISVACLLFKNLVISMLNTVSYYTLLTCVNWKALVRVHISAKWSEHKENGGRWKSHFASVVGG